MMMTMETQKRSDKRGYGQGGSHDGRAFVPPLTLCKLQVDTRSHIKYDFSIYLF